jgi:hypothetical protein
MHNKFAKQWQLPSVDKQKHRLNLMDTDPVHTLQIFAVQQYLLKDIFGYNSVSTEDLTLFGITSTSGRVLGRTVSPLAMTKTALSEAWPSYLDLTFCQKLSSSRAPAVRGRGGSAEQGVPAFLFCWQHASGNTSEEPEEQEAMKGLG